MPIVIMTGYADVPMAVDAMKDGAFDFIQKPFDPSNLMSIIQNAIDVDAQQRKAIQRREEISARLATLTKREREVLNHLIAGLNTKQIGSRLGVGLTTVDYHRNNILEKMEVENTPQLIHAIDLVELPER